MTRYLRAIVSVSLLILLLQISALAADHSKLVPAAPVPPQVVAAKKVFIANAGGDERWYEKPIFNGGPFRAYEPILCGGEKRRTIRNRGFSR
jgi:hypothetical protein